MTERLSAAMLEVLAACAQSPEGTAWIADLVRARVARGEGLDNARASVSRTLKRLERLGLASRLGKWDDQDWRRARRVWLTPEGRRRLATSRRVKVDRPAHGAHAAAPSGHAAAAGVKSRR